LLSLFRDECWEGALKYAVSLHVGNNPVIVLGTKSVAGDTALFNNCAERNKINLS
jgi:hypothetical protein